jgi:TonB family protein
MSVPFLAACAIKAAVIFTVAALAVRFARARSAALRHQIWAVGILCTLLLPGLTALIPGWHAIRSSAAIHLWQSAIPNPATAVTPALHGISVNATDARSASVAVRWVVAIWLAGWAALTARLLIGLVRLVRMSSLATPFSDPQFLLALGRLARQLGVRQAPALLVARDACTMPCTWGFRRPRILLPADCESWPEERRLIVLAHELAHIRRGDWPVRLMAECARSFYWFHPLAWIASASLAEMGERACDDAVLASGVLPDRYASELLDLVRTAANSNRSWSMALAVARSTNLERRFTAMLDSTQDRRRTTRRSLLFTTTTAVLLLLPLAALRAPGQDVSGRFTGTVLGPNGSGLPNATVILTSSAAHMRYMTVSDAGGAYEFTGLPSGDYQMTAIKPGSADGRIPDVTLDAGRDTALNITLNETGEPAAAPKPMGLQASAAETNLVHQVPPHYPAAAKAARMQGAVILDAVISAEGVPESLRVMNPQIDPRLSRAAVESVSQWRYQPVLLNGNAVSIQTTITVNFTLAP